MQDVYTISLMGNYTVLVVTNKLNHDNMGTLKQNLIRNLGFVNETTKISDRKKCFEIKKYYKSYMSKGPPL